MHIYLLHGVCNSRNAIRRVGFSESIKYSIGILKTRLKFPVMILSTYSYNFRVNNLSALVKIHLSLKFDPA